MSDPNKCPTCGQPYMVGEYRVDYTPLTAEEMATPDPLSAGLYKRTSPGSNASPFGRYGDRCKHMVSLSEHCVACEQEAKDGRVQQPSTTGEK